MPKNICPYISSHKKLIPCLEHSCTQYIQIIGMDPQTGNDINKWGCAAAFLPMLIIEGAQMGRQTGAAIESFRNEMVKANQASNVMANPMLLKNGNADESAN